jgi:hypothetical protein
MKTTGYDTHTQSTRHQSPHNSSDWVDSTLGNICPTQLNSPMIQNFEDVMNNTAHFYQPIMANNVNTVNPNIRPIGRRKLMRSEIKPRCLSLRRNLMNHSVELVNPDL